MSNLSVSQSGQPLTCYDGQLHAGMTREQAERAGVLSIFDEVNGPGNDYLSRQEIIRANEKDGLADASLGFLNATNGACTTIASAPFAAAGVGVAGIAIGTGLFTFGVCQVATGLKQYFNPNGQY